MARPLPTRAEGLVGANLALRMSESYASAPKGRVRWFDSAPVPLGWPWGASTAVLVLPATVGAILELHAYLTIALLVPGFALRWALANRVARGQDRCYRRVLPRGTKMILGGMTGLAVVLLTQVPPASAAPLAFVLVYVLIVEPAWWLAWKDQLEPTSRPSDSAG